MKKKIIIVGCIVLAVLCGLVFYSCATSEYRGEYYSEYPLIVGRYINANPKDDKYKDFYETYLLDYDEYIAYCEKYDLEPRYSSKEKKYIVHAMITAGRFCDIYVKRVRIHEQRAEVLIYYSVRGASTAGFDSELFVIPIEPSVTSVSVETKVKKYS
ncbi:MAG: hypothetical protein E7288_04460 [Lachnospiraceae bacterium]|nr:hypothetical protein [Lachnospiraceae bacterium]